MTINQPTIDFQSVAEKVSNIISTRETQIITRDNQYDVCKTNGFSEFGFDSLGKTVGFPAQFVREVDITNPSLAKEIVTDRVHQYFLADNNPFFTRSFGGEICGVVSSKYAYFDDDEVMDILDGSPLADYSFQYCFITPERLHLRAIDLKNKFRVDGDDSDLYMLYYVDNSMVGKSSFRIRVGVYRQVCSNGMIIPINNFMLCKATHRGKKDIAAEFNSSVAFLSEKKDDIKAILTNTASENASIMELKEEFQSAYVAKELNLNRTETNKVLELYHSYSYQYGKPSKWAFINAVTEFARDLPEGSLERRLFLESKALQAA